ncbi:MAG TPA: hypothetical protein VGF49_11900 [Candidatus Solibacter sp.]|jgi:TolA-binding protein
MNCQRVERENLMERYLAVGLGGELKEDFERHYFECAECAQQLETWTMVAKPLREMASAPAQPRRQWAGGVTAIAAGILVVIGVSLAPRNTAPDAPTATAAGASLAELARLEPPGYIAPGLRGAETSAETLFREAMEAYQRRDYAGAIAGLRASLRVDPEAAAPRFFLGASELLTGRTVDGMNDLGRVAASNSPFAEEARFDLAKGYLMLGRRREALVLLRIVESQGGDFAAQAHGLIDRIVGNRSGGAE